MNSVQWHNNIHLALLREEIFSGKGYGSQKHVMHKYSDIAYLRLMLVTILSAFGNLFGVDEYSVPCRPGLIKRPRGT